MDLLAFKRDIAGVKIEENPILVRQKSRDFYWYSPVLKRQLDHVCGDMVVTPASEAEVVRVVRAAFAHDVPLTARGALEHEVDLLAGAVVMALRRAAGGNLCLG